MSRFRSPEPSTSKHSKKSESPENFQEFTDLDLDSKLELKEYQETIYEIQSEVALKDSKEIKNVDNKKDDLPKLEDEPKIHFRCTSCGLDENCNYKGRLPPFVSGGIRLREDCYVMKDPFMPPPPPGKPKPEYLLIIGSDCCKCKKSVCKDIKCSFFYAQTYCFQCTEKFMINFPKEVQIKAKKHIAFQK